MEAPEPGIWPGIPAEDYHRWDAANYSTLKKFKKSAAHARDLLINPPQQTSSMALGSQLNDAILQPELFAEQYVVAPDVGDRRFKEAKTKWAEFQAQAADKTVLTVPEMYKIDAMSLNVRSQPIASKILASSGHAELSFVWNDAETGTLCKGRVDWFGSLWGHPVICDLKTTKDASPWGWPREIANFQYHIQAAFYMDGLAVISPSDKRTFLWLCVESASPYCAAVYQAEPALIEEGRHMYRNYLAKWTQCQETGVWDGYPSGLNMTDLPHWAYTSDEEAGL